MRKALLLVSILMISVITTACINNFAVQELNNKAMGFMEQGNYKEAIERLKSSVDLDDSIFETHYNLAVAYTKNEDYLKALEAYSKAIELKPDFADTYYSIAVTQENLASDLISGVLNLDEAGNIQKAPEKSLEEAGKLPDISEKTSQTAKQLMDEAVKNYETYLQKSPEAKDLQEVQSRVTDLKNRAASLSGADNAEKAPAEAE